LYRIRPSVVHEPWKPLDSSLITTFDSTETCTVTPNQLRWNPLSLDEGLDFISSWKTMCGSGSPGTRNGLAIYMYGATKSMSKKAFYNSDGDLLIVLQHGSLDIHTELGNLYCSPGEICVIPRGIRFSVFLNDSSAQGYILEVYDGHFELPELGPIGANGLANPRDFLYPTAKYQDINQDWTIINKYRGSLFSSCSHHCPFDVVAWHGNYSPFKYDLTHFNTINTVSFDHPDPSIFTVLTVKSNHPGVALADFVIFPPRWMVAENTFRPPYYHRNWYSFYLYSMSEFMGLISGQYDAKAKGFVPGGASLHSIMTSHGPDSNVFEKATKETLQPVKLGSNGMAFMFETNHMLNVTTWALGKAQPDYFECWQGLKKYFDPKDIHAGPK
jgi:homogentisate 1,2-dioxygenase